METRKTPPEIRLFELMKRIRKIGLDTDSLTDGTESPAQMALLDWIAANPGCGVQDIALGLGLTPPTVSIGVRKMEQKGNVERKPDPTDGRSVQFFLTQSGQDIQNKFQTEHLKKFRHLLAGLVESEQETLIELLARALESVDSKKP